ncbi:hypothetical protein V6U90_15940 [Micromonospora sp. CPCC 206060]|uniref:hypothetical protein n=1 Tax=Micromonospora sp. CPCC 206060 TaxID=3122406 RepID=UPI002FF08398
MLSFDEILERALLLVAEDLDLETAAVTADDRPLIGEDGEPIEVSEVQTLADAGVMCSNNGLLIRCTNGAEYTLTLNRRR